MKRIICLLSVLLLLLLPACGDTSGDLSAPPEETTPAPTVPASSEPTPSPTPEPAICNPLTGIPCDEDISGQRPVAVMLNNIKAAMPQQGNSQADIIYEVLAEGGITRMLGLYQTPGDAGLIGSVRSARQYYWELACGHDAVYIHAGGSPEFYSTKQTLGLTTVDGVNGYWPGMFWRDRDRIAGKHFAVEHSLLTSGEAIAAMLASHEELVPHAEGYTYEMSFTDDAAPADGQPAGTIVASFSSGKTTTFRYDAQQKLYLAEQYGEAYIDGNDNAQVSATNVLVLQTDCIQVANDDKGRIAVDLSSGSGWFACGGKIAPITWEKGTASQQLRYFDENGDPLVLGRGKSYVCIIPTTGGMTAE